MPAHVVTRGDEFVEYIAKSQDLTPAVRRPLELVDDEEIRVVLKRLDDDTLGVIYDGKQSGIIKAIAINERVITTPA